MTGGVSQLLRIFRPAPLPAPPPRLDAVELLGMLAEQSARAVAIRKCRRAARGPIPSAAAARRTRAATERTQADPAPRPKAGPARSRNPTLQANAFVVAAAAASPAPRSSWRPIAGR